MFRVVTHPPERTLAPRLLHPAMLAGRWAVVALGATLASGVFIRAAMAWPSLAHGANVSFGVHAHSHVAFFGWVVLAVASLAARCVAWTDASARQWRRVVHALGVLSLVALVAFAHTGYAAPTIALSAVHVLLWIPLVRLAWPLHHASDEERAWSRAAWMALLGAGAATLIPGIFAARGIRDGWWREFGIKLFLALFINGFAGFAAMGVLVSRMEFNHATATWARRLIAIALLPLAVLYVTTPPPMPWLTMLGRAAVGLVGAGTISISVLAWRHPRSVWIRTAILALGVTGMLEGLAAAGVGAPMMHDRPITIAFTHLVLLLGVTPVLAATLASSPAPVWRPVLATTGAATMCAALAAMGWPWLGALASLVGLNAMDLLTIAAAGGALAAGAWFTLFPLLFGAPAPEASE